MPIQLGPLQLEHPFVLAPLAGVTHMPFRRLMRKHGASLVVSELVSAAGIIRDAKKTMDLLAFHPEERPIGLQIFGEDEAALVQAAGIVEKLKPDFVDLNMGCPVPKVVRRGAGAGMVKDLKKLERILRSITRLIKLPFSIKIRSGWDDQNITAFEVLDLAADCGVAWIAIHARTRVQGYSGHADWELIKQLKAKSRIPIIGNGDLFTPAQCVQRQKESGVDAVMIGRGALRNPFIFEQALRMYRGESPKQASVQDYLSLLTEQRRYLDETYEPDSRAGMLHARKFIAWYGAGFPGCHDFRRRVFTEFNEARVLWDEAAAFFEKSVSARELIIPDEPFLMGGHG